MSHRAPRAGVDTDLIRRKRKLESIVRARSRTRDPDRWTTLQMPLGGNSDAVVRWRYYPATGRAEVITTTNAHAS